VIKKLWKKLLLNTLIINKKLRIITVLGKNEKIKENNKIILI